MRVHLQINLLVSRHTNDMNIGASMKYQKIKSIILQQIQRRIENLAEHLRWSVFRK